MSNTAPSHSVLHARAYRYLLPLAAVIPILPLLLAGPSCGHDFDFHVVSWLEAASQLMHGHYPQWAFTPAFNAGEPRFIFYPPLSWLLGAVLGVLLPWHYVPIAFTWLALTMSGFTLYRLAIRYAPVPAALLAAMFYMANPYMLFTAYERTAYGELLAAAWIPLLLTAMLARRITIMAVAVPVALLWLTNAPAAVMGCYVLALLTLVRLAGLLQVPAKLGRWAKKQDSGVGAPLLLVPQRPLAVAGITAAGVLLGFGLAAVYLVPAIAERHLVQTAMAVLPGMRIADNTLFHNTSDEAHDAVLHTASMLSLVLLAAAAALFAGVQGTRLGTRLRAARLPLAVLSLVIAFLLTPLSLPVWRHLPEMEFLQFPWRLLAILAAMSALEVGMVLRQVALPFLLLAGLALGGVSSATIASYDRFQQLCDVPDTVESRAASFEAHDVGSEPTDEYTPETADNDKLSHRNPRYWLGMDAQAAPPADARPGAVPERFKVDVPVAETLILNLRQYPAWHVFVNGRLVEPEPTGTRDDGLLTVPVPAGKSTVALEMKRTWDEDTGLGLSFVSLLLLLFLVTWPVRIQAAS